MNVGTMETEKCTWIDLFDDNERDSLEDGIFITGLLSIILGLWLNLSILLTKPTLDRSYRNLLKFTTAACVRRIVTLFVNYPFYNFVESTNEIDPRRCQFFAFLETFLAVLEVECLTHVCIERYVVAKYATNGWPIQKYHYTLFQCLCLFFASLYSFLPLMGIGKYSFDFHCSFCTFDMILPDCWKRYLVVVIFLLRSVKPAMFMLMMLTWARILETKLEYSEETENQRTFTKNVIIITLLNQFCWLPIAFIRGGVVLSQLLYYEPVVPASVSLIKYAMWIHWLAPALTTAALFIVDYKIRDKMLYLRSTKETIKFYKKKQS